MNNKIFFIASEEIPLYKSVAEVDRNTLASLPEEFQTSPLKREECLRFLITRMLRSHVPLTVDQIVQRYGITTGRMRNNSSFSSRRRAGRSRFIFVSKTKRCNGATGRTLNASTELRSTSSERKSSRHRSAASQTFLSHWQHRHPSTQESGESGFLNAFSK